MPTPEDAPAPRRAANVSRETMPAVDLRPPTSDRRHPRGRRRLAFTLAAIGALGVIAAACTTVEGLMPLTPSATPVASPPPEQGAATASSVTPSAFACSASSRPTVPWPVRIQG